ncbi:ABC transporter ATP-binding protein [Rhodococcus opacus]|nr:ABC transporter ATP-binding protein [Rhodococcus opacus]AHK34566.1 Putative nitrate transport ATP-binding protein NrtD [Rhodococcus opacus PD630]UDG96700.1 ABC transporter ATP-binding protein [Rhodococcus opacus PD630]
MPKHVDGATRADTKSSTNVATGPIFEVRDLAIGFDEREDVLHNVTMQVEPGEFVVLLGPSGCGKTTILNLAAGLLSPRSGYVRFDGAEINGVNTNVGYMTQDDTLLPWMPVHANVGLPLRMRGVSKSETKEKVEYYLSLLDLSEAGSLFPSQLSGGMRRRALLARSMIYDPRLLLMDEPFAALDAQLRHQMHVELRRTVKRLQQTVVFVTHDIAEAAKLADRVLIVGGGRPGHLVAEFQVPYGDDRDLENITYTDEYARFERELNEGLRSARDPRVTTVRA